MISVAHMMTANSSRCLSSDLTIHQKEIISSKYADVITTGNKGQIMKTVMPEFKGKADGKIVQQVVAELM